MKNYFRALLPSAGLLLLACTSEPPSEQPAAASSPTDKTPVAAITRPNMPVHPPQIATADTFPPAVKAYCGSCHIVPPAGLLTQKAWPKKIESMYVFMEEKDIAISAQHKEECLAYYTRNAPQALAPLPPDSSSSAAHFNKIPIGQPVRNFAPRDWASLPKITNVNFVDLDQDGQLDILVCDGQYHMLSWIHQENNRGVETPLAGLRTPLPGFRAPAHSAVFDFEGDGDLDIAVAILGELMPTDDLLGQVVLLLNDGRQSFTPQTIIKDVPRIADVQAADLDGDGDTDFAVAMFGMFKTGDVVWLEQTSDGQFDRVHTLSEKNGCIRVPIGDLNNDGKPDVVALITQEFEEIVAFINQGDGQFAEYTLFQALNPSFGSSGLQLVDLDQDDDLDLLFTNGDGFDGTDAKPYHGVQWLENLGDLRFAYRDLTRFYGAYSARAADMDADGDLDIVAANCFMSSDAKYWEELPGHGLIWLENDGNQQFARHALTRYPSHFVSIDVGDLDNDGKPDIVTGGMNVFPPFPPAERMNRVSLWLNRLPSKK